MTRHVASTVDGEVMIYESVGGWNDEDVTFYWCCTKGACSTRFLNLNDCMASAVQHTTEDHDGEVERAE